LKLALLLSSPFLSSPLALFSQGRVICWGENNNGQLGRDGTVDVGATAGEMATLSFITFSDTLPAMQITGTNHVCALHVNRRVRCWGRNNEEQLGNGTASNRGSGTGALSVTNAVYVTFAPSINTIPIVAVDAGL
jgi:alpha-tubulin suppressor-like RCC1 family protein